jgi:hypothetical protein
LVEQFPAVELVPTPQVPDGPHWPSLWQANPAAQVPFFPTPPQVPRPQSAFLWQPTTLQIPPPQVPRPQVALEVHAVGLHVDAAQEPPSQSESPAQVQVPARQVLPVPQSPFTAHLVCWQVPVVAPGQAKPELGQSALDWHGSVHWPSAPTVEPVQLAV